MKKLFFISFSILFFISCSKENTNTMFVKGNIKGLKKGTLYLKKQIDSLVVSIDSIMINGSEDFLLTDEVISPEMYYLALDNGNKKIPFFGEKDTITITSRLDKFIVKAKITGSKNQAILDDYYDVINKFNDQNLDLIKEDFEAKKLNNQDSILVVEKKIKSLIRRKILYTTNFAINNADFEVAPYIALTELNNATIKLLDTVNNSLSTEVKKSKYGIQLNEFINKIKESEN